VIDQQQMAKLHAERLGFSHWRAASHGEHLHIAASRANGDGSVVPDGVISDEEKKAEQSSNESFIWCRSPRRTSAIGANLFSMSGRRPKKRWR
jgi:hypothetical protein